MSTAVAWVIVIAVGSAVAVYVHGHGLGDLDDVGNPVTVDVDLDRLGHHHDVGLTVAVDVDLLDLDRDVRVGRAVAVDVDVGFRHHLAVARLRRLVRHHALLLFEWNVAPDASARVHGTAQGRGNSTARRVVRVGMSSPEGIMRKRILVPSISAAMATIAVYLLIGVSGPGAAATDPTTSSSPPPAAGTAVTRTVTVTGDGEATGTPDVAELSIGVSSRAKAAADALGTMSDRANKLIDVIKNVGVADKDVQTVGLSLQPITDDAGQVTGYEAGTTVIAQIDDIGKVGPSIDAASKQVGDDVRIDGVSFSFADAGSLDERGATDAVKRARRQAEELSKAAGVELGDVLSISEGSTASPVPSARAGAADTASVPVQPGSQSVSVSVTMVFAVR